ncbi:neurexin, partial [Clonorchis sinensis]
ISSNPSLAQALVIGSDEGRHIVNISIPLPINNQTIFIGGYPMTGVQDELGVNGLFTSKTGFSGCVASIGLDHSSDDMQRTRSSSGLVGTAAYLAEDAHTSNLLSDDLSTLTRWNNVSPGCNVFSNEVRHRYDGHCTPRICHFDGRCVQQLGATRCDCSMTSLAGKYCTDVGAAIHLSSSPLGILKFELSPPQNTTRDHLAFGIQATKRGSRSLVTIKGHGASTDFLRVSLIPLKSHHVLLVRYNMGGGQQTLLEHNVDIADGRYHVVQLIRDGANCMLRIDLEHERVNIPKGTQGMHFNDIKYIQVGTPLTTWQGDTSTSRNQSSSEYDQAFEGYITGLNYNGIDLLQVVKGLIIPGIFLSAGHDIEMKSGFQPNMEHLQAAQKSTVPLTANDMQVHSRQNVPTDHRSEPLIVPRINCLQPEGGYDAKTCLPSDEDGLIRPFIEFSRTAVLEETTKKPSGANHWNADQSRNKQPQPNDSGSLNIASNSHAGEVGVHDYHPYNQPNQRKQHNPDVGLDGAAFSSKSFQNPEEIDIFEIAHDGLKPEYAFKKHYVFNIGLIASVSAGGICVLIVITCVIYRCMRRDEGSYNVDESLAYTGEPTRTPTSIGHRLSKDPQISDSLTMRNLTKSEDEGQCLQMAGKTALIVTFSDTCKANISTANSPCPLNSPKREAPTSPSLGSIESDKRKSDLVRIESPTERKSLSVSKSKSGKKINDSQECRIIVMCQTDRLQSSEYFSRRNSPLNNRVLRTIILPGEQIIEDKIAAFPKRIQTILAVQTGQRKDRYEQLLSCGTVCCVPQFNLDESRQTKSGLNEGITTNNNSKPYFLFNEDPLVRRKQASEADHATFDTSLGHEKQLLEIRYSYPFSQAYLQVSISATLIANSALLMGLRNCVSDVSNCRSTLYLCDILDV